MKNHIQQIDPNSLIFPKECLGKWFCSTVTMGRDGDPIIRYLQEDGSWGKTAFYFDNNEQVQIALRKGGQPDFSLTEEDMLFRAIIREDCQKFDYFDEWDCDA